MRKGLFLVPSGIILFILFFTIFGDRGLLRIYHLNRDKKEMQSRLLELKSENDKLKREIEALRTDRRYLESIARRDFGFVRKNEIIYQFSPQEQFTSSKKKAAATKSPNQHKEALKIR
jgi:cell division protein FtsB